MQYRFILATLVAATVYAAPAGNPAQKRYEPFEPLDSSELQGILPEETMMLAVTNAEQKREPLEPLLQESMMLAIVNPDQPAASPISKRQPLIPEEVMMLAVTNPESPLSSPISTEIIAKKREPQPIIPEEVMMVAVTNPEVPLSSPISTLAIAKKREAMIPSAISGEFMMVAEPLGTPGPLIA